MRIKDLPEDFNLVGCKLGNKYIHSGWSKGFWLSDSRESSKVDPIFFKSYEDIKDWEVGVPPERMLRIKVEK